MKIKIYYFERQNMNKNTTSSFLTKYERARIIGTRALQLSMDAVSTVDTTNMSDPLKIAEKELLHNKIPIIIRRYLPNGLYEDCKLKDLKTCKN